jgi:ABC-type branched-subunit amino acid transport system substrate-binding protein
LYFVDAILVISVLAGFPTATPAPDAARGTKPDRLVIGLLAATGPSSESLTAGAERAVNEINAAGGIDGLRLDLVTLAAPGPWRDGAGLTARLVFENRVVGLIGPTDEGSAHVAAQIATRKRIPVITLSPEDSLTKAMVPWVFRGVPDDGTQARALLRWSFADPRGKTAVLAVPEGRSGRERAAALEGACSEVGVQIVQTLVGDRPSRRGTAAADVLLLWLDPGPAVDRLLAQGRRGTPRRILGSTRLDVPEFVGEAPDWTVGLALPLLRAEASSAVIAPGLPHALGYDGVRAMAGAALREGPEPGALRRGLAEGQVRGRSGTFGFDQRGNRVGPINVGVVRDGRLHRVRRAESAGPAGPASRVKVDSTTAQESGTPASVR